MGISSAWPFLRVDVDASGRYANGLAWLDSSQVVVLTADETIRVINLDPVNWRNRLSSLQFRSAGPGEKLARAAVPR
jgi:hypothetical protein